MDGSMSAEMESLHKNSVWELVLKPKDQKVIGSKWFGRKKASMIRRLLPTKQG